VTQQCSQRASIKLFVIRHYELRERIVASQYDMTTVLALFVEADFL
jgi:hypothetical protein